MLLVALEADEVPAHWAVDLPVATGVHPNEAEAFDDGLVAVDIVVDVSAHAGSERPVHGGLVLS